MSKQEGAVPDRYRAIKAATVVLTLVVMAPGIDALARVTGGSAEPASPAGAIDARSIVQPADPFATLEQIEDAAVPDGPEVPEGFAREVGFLPGYAEVRVDGSGMVVGYTVEGTAADVSADLVAHMESRGWSAVSLGGVEGATFSKSEGACTWALATCAQVGDVTSVVVRCMYS